MSQCDLCMMQTDGIVAHHYRCQCHDAEKSTLHCHPDCLRIAHTHCPIDLARAAKFMHRSSWEENQRRYAWTRAEVATYIPKLFETADLPPEVWAMIADGLLEIGAVLAVCRALDQSRLYSTFSFDATDKVWCDFTNFLGLQYVSLVGNAATDRSTLVFSPGDQSASHMYVKENYLGVLDVIFGNPEDITTTKSVSGIWWRTIPLSSSHVDMQADPDNVKIRGFSKQPNTAWSVPEPEHVYFETIGGNQREPARMSYFTCNAAEHIGYSISWRLGIIGVYTHRKGETMHHFGLDPADTCWFYMPVESDERITMIWRRQGIFASLALKTSKGRIFDTTPMNAFGPWKLIHKPCRKRSRIFFEDSVDGIGLLGFETPLLEASDERPPSRNMRPPMLSIEPCFYSASLLEDLTTIIPCGSPSLAITGLLLIFSDRHRESLGQARIDLLTEPVVFDGTFFLV